jgi:L-histidine Nalpha-methyltransferase
VPAGRKRSAPHRAERYSLDIHADEAAFLAMLADDVRRGLEARPRSLPPKYFYDHAGSVLFERITELPEYYLTRVEEVIIRDVAAEVVRQVRPRDIVELGPGFCRKVRFLFDVMGDRGDIRYVPVDVGRDGLANAVGALIHDYPALDVHAVVGDFERHLERIPPPVGRRLVLFLGSTIGNFDPLARRTLLIQIRRLLGPDDRLLLGIDLVKDRAVLEAAYNDAAGVTREFNRNILRVVNRELDGDFRPEGYRHHAFYRAEASRVEMHLIATAPQRVRVRRLGLVVELAEAEGIWTESSYKFTRESTETMLAEAGLAINAWYTDSEARFGLVLARPLSPDAAR